MMRSILVIIAFLAASSTAKLTKECVVDFLKFRRVDDESFGSIDTSTVDPIKCADEMKSRIAEIYGSAQAKMEAHIKQKPYASCVMEKLRSNEEYPKVLLIVDVIEMKGIGLRFWKIGAKKSRIEELQNQAQNLSDQAFIDCKGRIDYGAFFDSFIEQKRMEPLTDEYDYCLRRHLVDKLVISTVEYNFKVNPKNINTAYLNCAETIDAEILKIRSSIQTAGSACVINTFIENGYLNTMLKIQLLSKLNLTPVEKANEKNKFIDSMINMTHRIKSCPM